jgi:short/branched chain acyl-CoA dehydrogenase
MCDVHNTLVNSTLRLYGNEDVKARFLPRLATNTVRPSRKMLQQYSLIVFPHAAWFFLLVRAGKWIGCLCVADHRQARRIWQQLHPQRKQDVSRSERYYNSSGEEDIDHIHAHRWITNSAEAGIFLVFANVDPSKGYKGITCFALDKEMGVTIAKKEKKVGRFRSEMNPFLDG